MNIADNAVKWFGTSNYSEDDKTPHPKGIN